MPSAQGHMTVKRRPKDGSNGNDAVRYWVVPSATQIKRAQDGTMYPSKVTCEKRKQTGNSQPVATSEGTLYYQVGYSDSTVSAKTQYSTSGVNVTSATAWIKFMLEIGGLEVANETVSVVADGRSVSSVKEWYLRWPQSSGVTTEIGGWTQTVPQLTQTYKYLWNYEEISFDDGTTTKTSPAIIGVYGRGIKSVANYYLATSAGSGVTTATKGWTTDIQYPTQEKRYLWNYEVVTYDDDSTTTKDPHIICVYGEKGDPGVDGIGIDGKDGHSIILANTTKRQYTLSQWLNFHGGSYTQLDYWGSIENVAEYQRGDIIVIPGIITDLDDTDCLSYWRVDSVEVSNKRVNCYATTTFIYGKKGKPGNDGIGVPGKTYKPMRVREWSRISNESQLTAGLSDFDDWTDIVYMYDEEVESGISYWQCIQNFTKKAGQIPPDNNNDTGNELCGKLKKTSNMATLATDIFLANYAVIRNLGVESIEMRDSSGTLKFYAKDGVVVCNTGTFHDVNVEGNLRASKMDLCVSTSTSGRVPNGSLCFDTNSLTLPALDAGFVRSIKIYNPVRTRTNPADLTLVPVASCVKICTTETFDMARSETKTLSGCGMNGGVYIELLGINLGDDTIWTPNIQTITSAT